MNKHDIWFVVVTYKPQQEALRRLMGMLKGHPTEVITNTRKNLGYGGGANVGMKRVFDRGAVWAIVCNQDIKLTGAGVGKFIKELGECDPGIVGPEGGSLDPKRWTTILPSREPVDYISGSCMAIHRDVYKRIGGFYEPYFMYYEDADLCVRAKRAGFPLCQVAIDGFRHTAHGSEYYLARNHLLFVFRNAPVSVKLRELVRLPKTFWEYFYGHRS